VVYWAALRAMRVGELDELLEPFIARLRR